MEQQNEWHEDDVVTMPMHVDCNVPMQYVLWQLNEDKSWQIRRVYNLIGNLQTTNFAGYFTADEMTNATKIGRWDDAVKRVILPEDEGEPEHD